MMMLINSFWFDVGGGSGAPDNLDGGNASDTSFLYTADGGDASTSSFIETFDGGTASG